ncbi:hypothetical protein [Aliarcobacter skirrowii]|uniref:Uncharacterized protein n=1 Tax=Aliarcobacter skirrowii TaxID=28200 RepID=A0AAW9D8R2_9BACT|nr:hypothetical protein [Aliarcobacter skirrowii]MDX4068648.1 hypothetical protein [Aliarcobacter skirrowii]
MLLNFYFILINGIIVFIINRNIGGFFNVYGHTIFEEPKINEYSCGIDLGCCYKDNTSKIPNPRICALEFPSMKLFIQENIED